jgi:hypothetical protein
MLTRHVGRGSTEPLSTFSSIDGGRSRICSSGTSRGGPLSTSSTTKKIQKRYAGKKICWPHLRVRCLSRGGSGGHCQYPADPVPPRTSSKSRQRKRHALTRAHVSMTLGYATRHEQLGCCQLLLSSLGQLRCHHMSRGPSS